MQTRPGEDRGQVPWRLGVRRRPFRAGGLKQEQVPGEEHSMEWSGWRSLLQKILFFVFFLSLPCISFLRGQDRPWFPPGDGSQFPPDWPPQVLGLPPGVHPLPPLPERLGVREIPFSQDPWLLLQKRLKELRQELEWQRWLEELQKQLAQGGQIDSKWMDKIQKKLAEHPELLQQMQKQLQKSQRPGEEVPPGKDGAAPNLDQLAQQLRQLIQEPPRPAGNGEDAELPALPHLQAPPTDEELDRWLASRLHDLENSRWGDLLRNSPAFQKALAELRGGMGTSLVPGALPGVEHLPLPRHGLPRNLFPDGWSLPRLPALPWRPQVTLPQLPVPHLPTPSVHLPAGSLPGLRGGGGLIALVIILVVLISLWLAWYAIRWLSRRAQTTPLPVCWPLPAWDQISSREELVRAFDYLVWRLLGSAAQSWNHQQAAAHLAALRPEGTEGQRAAQELAAWYALARYAPAEELLPPQALSCARQHLVFFAEALRS
jgi:hypothetical protein